MSKHIIRVVNRVYRSIKTFLLVHKIPVITWTFFWLLQGLDFMLSGRKISEAEKLTNKLWKQNYLSYWTTFQNERIFLQTEHPVAYYSDDTRFPRGAVFDNSKNYRFNLKIYNEFKGVEKIRLLDLGCSGGGLVRSFLEDGHIAIGLEGADVSKRFRSAEWDNIPHHLFTCDITRPFQLVDAERNRFLFDVVTAWEVFEHIPEDKLPGLLSSIKEQLKPGGYVIVSVDLLPDGNPLTGAVYHQTLKPGAWWIEQFIQQGFVMEKKEILSPEDMVRGNGLSIKDWWPAHGHGIHIVARKPGVEDPDKASVSR